MTKKIVLLVSLLSFLLFACDSGSSDPNKIGGDTDIDLSKVGNEYGVFFEFDGISLNTTKLKDTIMITNNDNGIVTVGVKMVTDWDFYFELEKETGLDVLPEQARRNIIDYYLDRYDARIDTSDADNLVLELDINFKVTSEGIQEFVTSKNNFSKPFTIIKYSSKVGDKYEITDPDGVKRTRTVVYKSKDDEWPLVWWRIKVTKVEEYFDDDPLVEKATYIANHKFGLVAVIYNFKDGREVMVETVPWAMI